MANPFKKYGKKEWTVVVVVPLAVMGLLDFLQKIVAIITHGEPNLFLSFIIILPVISLFSFFVYKTLLLDIFDKKR